jgi:hypothetical protein
MRGGEEDAGGVTFEEFAALLARVDTLPAVKVPLEDD